MSEQLWSDERIEQAIDTRVYLPTEEGYVRANGAKAREILWEMRDEYEAKLAEAGQWQPIKNGDLSGAVSICRRVEAQEPTP